ncbi:MAG: hypothetical protein AVDCRST_MAG33-1873, partial [uncultured Thermomicrobiales bacterium]
TPRRIDRRPDGQRPAGIVDDETADVRRGHTGVQQHEDERVLEIRQPRRTTIGGSQRSAGDVVGEQELVAEPLGDQPGDDRRLGLVRSVPRLAELIESDGRSRREDGPEVPTVSESAVEMTDGDPFGGHPEADQQGDLLERHRPRLGVGGDRHAGREVGQCDRRERGPLSFRDPSLAAAGLELPRSHRPSRVAVTQLGDQVGGEFLRRPATDDRSAMQLTVEPRGRDDTDATLTRDPGQSGQVATVVRGRAIDDCTAADEAERFGVRQRCLPLVGAVVRLRADRRGRRRQQVLVRERDAQPVRIDRTQHRHDVRLHCQIDVDALVVDEGHVLVGEPEHVPVAVHGGRRSSSWVHSRRPEPTR